MVPTAERRKPAGNQKNLHSFRLTIALVRVSPSFGWVGGALPTVEHGFTYQVELSCLRMNVYELGDH